MNSKIITINSNEFYLHSNYIFMQLKIISNNTVWLKPNNRLGIRPKPNIRRLAEYLASPEHSLHHYTVYIFIYVCKVEIWYGY